jgi:hypothetical protein
MCIYMYTSLINLYEHTSYEYPLYKHISIGHEKVIIPTSNLFQHLISPKANTLIEKVSHFIIHKIMPAENLILNHMYESPNKWSVHPLMEELKVSTYFH